MVSTNPTVAAMGGYALEELRHRVAALRAEGHTLHDFSIGDPDEPTPAIVRLPTHAIKSATLSSIASRGLS